MVMSSSQQLIGRIIATWQRTCGVDVPPKIFGIVSSNRSKTDGEACYSGKIGWLLICVDDQDISLRVGDRRVKNLPRQLGRL